MEDLEKELQKVINDIGKIDVSNILNEVTEHSVKFAYFTALYEKLKIEEERLKFVLKVVEAEIDKELRETVNGKVTEKMIERFIVLDERYKKAYEDWLSARERAGLIKAVVLALDHKRDMINNAVNLVRDELKGKFGLFIAD